MDKNKLYRMIPKVDVLLEDEKIQKLISDYSRDGVMEAIRVETEAVRGMIAKETAEVAQEAIENLISRIESYTIGLYKPHIQKVINGTGTILHTNLGRAPISKKHMDYIASIATGYSNLEYNLQQGKRGERYAHFEKLLCELTGAEAAMAVNNNASAVMLILNTMCKDSEVVVSRGELVEIGGKFRVPDVMEQSNATLVEIGTTNKTHLSDYEEAITEETSALLKVHTSNYRIVGFTETVSIGELSALAKEKGLPIIEDLGSGVLIDLSKYGITYEPTVQDSIRAGADVVCFSGDKLLGGPQAGIIIGKKKYIDKMKKNQLTRALRIDKFTATALEAVLSEYRSEEEAIHNIPVMSMITKSQEEIKKEAQSLKRALLRRKLDVNVSIVPCESQIGGGSLPLERIPSYGVSIAVPKISTESFKEALHHVEIPIITRVVEDEILIDMRTIKPDEISIIAQEMEEVIQGNAE